MSHVMQWAQHNAVMIGSAAVLAVTATGVAAVGIKKRKSIAERRKLSAGTMMAVVAFVVCTSVSLHTNYGFAGADDGLHMATQFERVFSCAAFESLMAMFVFGARERLADPKTQSPGWFGVGVWVFAALSSVPAWHEGHGMTASTLVRVIAGSFGSALAAHAALGLELRHRSGEQSQAASAQIAREIRERVMARLGLAQRGQTAQEIARERALDRAVDLADREARLTDNQRKGWKGRRVARELGRALDEAKTNEPARRQLFEERLALRRHATELRTYEIRTPWTAAEGAGAEKLEAEAEAMRTQLEKVRQELAEQTDRAGRAEAAAAEARQHGAAAVALLTRHVEAAEELAEGIETEALAGVGNAEAHPVDSLLPRPRPERAAEHAGDAQDEPDDTVNCDEEEQPGSGNAERSAAAGVPSGSFRVQVRVPITAEDEQDRDQDEEPEDGQPLDLTSYNSKKAALQALYHRDIAEDDPRSINAIAVVLRQTYHRETGKTFDQASAHRAISELRPKARPADQQDDDDQESA